MVVQLNKEKRGLKGRVHQLAIPLQATLEPTSSLGSSLHPVLAESVAWLTGLLDRLLLGSLFAQLSITACLVTLKLDFLVPMHRARTNENFSAQTIDWHDARPVGR